ncbi:fascin domain-containing protein [Actinophytocola xanthii]|uniref:fascin domain-containing protein n=1 Tax=Actinophytocola xanthii TaxID=1912961 RepID=UPI00117783B6|nr:hypothetical protein [Actinophytocola xanthii]
MTKRLWGITFSVLALLTALVSTPAAAAPPSSLAEAVAQQNRNVSAAACYNVTIRSLANGRLVSAELGWGGNDYGLLRARATALGAWEWFRVCFNGSNSTIRSLANNRYVSAEIGWGGNDYGLLRARATAVGAWERFSFASCGSGCVTIRSTANNRLVSAELGWGGNDYGLLRARATAVGAWERFQ